MESYTQFKNIKDAVKLLIVHQQIIMTRTFNIQNKY